MSNPDDELWRDVFAEGMDPAFATTSRAGTIRYARRLRRRRKAAGLAVAVVAVGVLLGVAMFPPVPARVTVRAAQAKPATLRPSTVAAAIPIHFLTDEELLKRFPGRPVALIGSPDQRQELVFLDDPRSVRTAVRDRENWCRSHRPAERF